MTHAVGVFATYHVIQTQLQGLGSIRPHAVDKENAYRVNCLERNMRVRRCKANACRNRHCEHERNRVYSEYIAHCRTIWAIRTAITVLLIRPSSI